MMNTGIGNRTPPAEPPSGLPEVLGVKTARVRFNPPKRFLSGGEYVEAREAFELLVRTSEPLPVADVMPVIFIGEVPIGAGGAVGANLYRFFVYEFDRAPQGAVISLGWPDAPARKRPTRFRFDPAGESRPPVA